MSMKELADQAIANLNERMSTHVDSRCASTDEVYMTAMACRIQELEDSLFKFELGDLVKVIGADIYGKIIERSQRTDMISPFYKIKNNDDHADPNAYWPQSNLELS